MYPNKGNKLKIVGIKTKQGYLISDSPSSHYDPSVLKKYYINGKFPRESFHKHWVWVDEKPIKIEFKKSQSHINHRYILIDESLQSDKFPLEFKREDVASYDTNDYEWYWKDEYQHLRSLYKLVSDPQPDIMVEIDFEYETVLELDEVKEFNGFAYPVQRTQWPSDGLTNLTEKHVTHQILDKILFPEPVLPMLPCKLTSEQMYKITRQYIKQHINYEVAEITSDYNFCFAVAKKIKLENPIKKEIEILTSKGKSYKNRKYKTNYQSVRQVKVFEMTYSPENYKGYTPIQGMTAENIEDLQNKVDTFLKELIEMINEPLVDCPHCEGKGVMLS